MTKKAKRFPLYGFIGIGGMIFAYIGLLRNIYPVKIWFYIIVWWSFLLIVDALNYYRRNDSLIKRDISSFFALMCWSVFFWLVFEAFNLQLKNWHYIKLPRNIITRWTGYFFAYATVLPAVFEVKDLIDSFVSSREKQKKDIISPEINGLLLFGLIILGILMLIIPLIWPAYFFPLVWIGVVFLIEPFLLIWGKGSIYFTIKRKNASELWKLLLTGLILGFLWEFWNYWVISKWIYTVPFVGRWKLFEMPILGFLGFPPFAVECWLFVNLIDMIIRLKEPTINYGNRKFLLLPSSLKGKISIFLLWGIFYMVMFYMIDLYTVRSFF